MAREVVGAGPDSHLHPPARDRLRDGQLARQQERVPEREIRMSWAMFLAVSYPIPAMASASSRSRQSRRATILPPRTVNTV